MCFTLNSDAGVKIAKHNKSCYKYMNLTKDGEVTSMIVESAPFKLPSLRRPALSDSGKGQPVTELKTLSDLYIEEGYHSYKNWLHPTFWDDRGVLVKCNIPKGAKYYSNSTQFVSTELSFLKICKVRAKIISNICRIFVY